MDRSQGSGRVSLGGGNREGQQAKGWVGSVFGVSQVPSIQMAETPLCRAHVASRYTSLGIVMPSAWGRNNGPHPPHKPGT